RLERVRTVRNGGGSPRGRGGRGRAARQRGDVVEHDLQARETGTLRLVSARGVHGDAAEDVPGNRGGDGRSGRREVDQLAGDEESSGVGDCRNRREIGRAHV